MARPKGAKDKKPRKLRPKLKPEKPAVPPRLPKRPPSPPRSEKDAENRKRLGQSDRAQHGGPGRTPGSRDMRIILTEFGDLSIKEIEKKANDESIPIRERAVLATWVRAQRDQRAFDSIMSRMYGQPVQPATIGNPDGTPLDTATTITVVRPAKRDA